MVQPNRYRMYKNLTLDSPSIVIMALANENMAKNIMALLNFCLFLKHVITISLTNFVSNSPLSPLDSYNFKFLKLKKIAYS